MRAFDLMTTPVVTTTPDTTVEHAAVLVSEHGVSMLPVVDAEDRVLGVVSGEDLLREELRRRPKARHVREAMTSPAVSVSADVPVGEVARQLLGHHHRALPVVHDGRLVGVISRNDLLRALTPQDEITAARVSKTLADHMGARAWDVVVLDGVATVLGPFTDRAEELAATAYTASVSGIRSVVVRPSATGARGDLS